MGVCEGAPGEYCGHVLEPEDREANDHWHKMTRNAVCLRDPKYDGFCVWHADTDEKTAEELAEERLTPHDVPWEADHVKEHLSGAILRGISFPAGFSFGRCVLVFTEFNDTNLREGEFRGANLRKAEFSDTNLCEAEFRGANLRKAEFCDADLPFAEFPDTDLRRAEFHDVDLRMAEFPDSDLRRARFPDSDLRRARFPDSNLFKADFSCVKLQRAEFPGADLRRAQFPNSDLFFTIFSGSDLRKADFPDASLVLAEFPDATFTDAEFRDVDLRKAKFPNADLRRAEFFDADLFGAEFPGTTLGEAEFLDVDLRKAEFPDADLREAEFSDTYLRGVDFSDADLREAEFSDTYLRGADFSDANLRRIEFRDANLRKAEFRDAYIHEAEFHDADLRETEFRDAYTREAEFHDTSLRDANFHGTYLCKAEFRGTNLREAELPDADLSGAEFLDTDLSGAEFLDTDLSGAEFLGTDLREAKFSEANAQKAVFSKADLRGVVFKPACVREKESEEDGIGKSLAASLEDVQFEDGTDLRGANLTGARLYQAAFKDVRINDETTFSIDDRHRYGTSCRYEYDPNSRTSINENVSRLRAAAWTYRRLESLFRENAMEERARDAHISKEEAQRDHYKKQLKDDSLLRGPRLKSLGQYAASTLNWRLHRHGESLRQLLKVSAFLILGCGVLYPFVGGIDSTHSGGPYQVTSLTEFIGSKGWLDIGNGLYFSAITFTTIGYGDFYPAGTGSRALVALESLAGALLIALFVFVIGRRVAR